MSEDLDQILAECFRLLEETGDLQSCLDRYPAVARFLIPHLEIQAGLKPALLEEPSTKAKAEGWAVLQAALDKKPQRYAWLSAFRGGLLTHLTSAAVGAALVLFVVGSGSAAVGVSVPGVNDVLGVMGFGQKSPDSDDGAPAVEGATPGKEASTFEDDGLPANADLATPTAPASPDTETAEGETQGNGPADDPGNGNNGNGPPDDPGNGNNGNGPPDDPGNGNNQGNGPPENPGNGNGHH